MTDGGHNRDGRTQNSQREGTTQQRDDRAERPPGDGADRDGRGDRRSGEVFADRFASSAVRIGLIFIGLVITVFALGQAVGVNFLGMIAQALGTQTGQWLLVALVGILLIVVAQRGLSSRD